MKSHRLAKLQAIRKSQRVRLLKAVYGDEGEYPFPNLPSAPQQIRYVLAHEPPHYIAQCLDVDVSSFGDTPRQAVQNLQEAVRLYYRPLPRVLGTGRANLYAEKA